MLVTLIGWTLAGWSGAVLATLAMFVPSSIVCFAATRGWSRLQGKAWYNIVQESLAPVGTGLIAAGIIALLRVADAGPLSIAAASATGALLLARPKTSPFVLILLVAAVFAMVRLAVTQPAT